MNKAVFVVHNNNNDGNSANQGKMISQKHSVFYQFMKEATQLK